MAASLKRGTMLASFVTSTGMLAYNAANLLKPLVLNPHSTKFFHTWCNMLLTALHHLDLSQLRHGVYQPGLPGKPMESYDTHGIRILHMEI